MLSASELRTNLAHFRGDLERYRLSINDRIISTPGVKYLAENAGAFWLADAIASHFHAGSPLRIAMEEDSDLIYMHFWNLKVNREVKTAVLTCRKDSGMEPIVKQEIEYTDFPLDEIDIWCGLADEDAKGYRWTIYLPSEH